MPRVDLSPRAAELLVTLTGIPGPLMFHRTGGCCDGSAPICYPNGDFTLGGSDVHLGDLTVEGVDESASTCPPRSSRTGSTPPPVDVVEGRGSGFSVEAPEGVRFIVRSRLLTDDEVRELGDSRPVPE
ncbi:MAG TPA: DUF779 domain-containing protein [Actinomycetospora sp.]|nr:DUF779 domain-containing protein [Actinomycetospora sp.]